MIIGFPCYCYQFQNIFILCLSFFLILCLYALYAVISNRYFFPSDMPVFVLIRLLQKINNTKTRNWLVIFDITLLELKLLCSDCNRTTPWLKKNLSRNRWQDKPSKRPEYLLFVKYLINISPSQYHRTRVHMVRFWDYDFLPNEKSSLWHALFLRQNRFFLASHAIIKFRCNTNGPSRSPLKKAF